MPKRKIEDMEESIDATVNVPDELGAVEDWSEFPEVNDAPHPLEGKFFHFDGSWWHVQDSKRVYVQSAWDLPSDREVVRVTAEEFDALA